MSQPTASKQEKQTSRKVRQQEQRRLAKIKKEKLQRELLEELDRELQTEPKIRLRDNGPDDEHLIKAATTGSYIEIENLLKERDEYSQEALDKSLMIAANNGQKLALILLLKYGANTNWTDDNGNTSLMICAEKGYLDMTKILLANRADANKFNTSGNTALILSVKASGAADMTRLLVSSSSVNVKNHEGQTALTKSVEFGDLDTIHILISNGANLDEVTNGETVLEIANKKGILQYIKVFSDCKVYKQPPIVAALKYRDLLLVETILTYEPNCINQRTPDGSTALDTFFDFILTEKKGLSSVDKSIIKLLIKRGVNVNKKDFKRSKVRRQQSENDSSLVKAVQIGDLDIVKWLSIKGSQVNESVGYEQFTPLMMASKCGFPEITFYLLSKGADIEVKRKEGTAMDIAVKYGHLDCAKILLEEKAKKGLVEAYKLAIEYKQLCLLEHLDEKFTLDTKDMRLTELAIQSGNKEIFQYLVNKGLDVNENITKQHYYSYNETKFVCPIHIAVINEKPDIIEVLLQCKANINIKDSNGNTALFYACAKKSSGVVTLLLKSGSDVNVTNNSGKTPLFNAIESKERENITLLLKSGASVNVCDNLEVTPMLIAIQSHSLEIVSLLIHWNADTSTITKNGGTYVTELLRSFHYSSEDMLPILKLLLKEKIDIDKQDKDGDTALMIACEKSMTEAVTILLKHGVDVNKANSNNRTALSKSLKGDTVSIAKMLLQKKAEFRPLSVCQQGVHLFISKYEWELIPLALGQGVYPFVVKSGYSNEHIFYSSYRYAEDLSPLSMALHERRLDLAKYLIQVRFLTKYDVSGLLKKNIFQKTIMSTEQDTIFNNMLSLYTLSFVQISDMLGATLDREEKVNKLPLPLKMRQQLLFRSLNVPLVVSERVVLNN